jgi:hypothetical protein
LIEQAGLPLSCRTDPLGLLQRRPRVADRFRVDCMCRTIRGHVSDGALVDTDFLQTRQKSGKLPRR